MGLRRLGNSVLHARAMLTRVLPGWAASSYLGHTREALNRAPPRTRHRSFHSPPCGGAPRVPVYARQGGADRSRILVLLLGDGRPLAYMIRTTVQKNRLPGRRL